VVAVAVALDALVVSFASFLLALTVLVVPVVVAVAVAVAVAVTVAVVVAAEVINQYFVSNKVLPPREFMWGFYSLRLDIRVMKNT